MKCTIFERRHAILHVSSEKPLILFLWDPGDKIFCTPTHNPHIMLCVVYRGLGVYLIIAFRMDSRTTKLFSKCTYSERGYVWPWNPLAKKPSVDIWYQHSHLLCFSCFTILEMSNYYHGISINIWKFSYFGCYGCHAICIISSEISYGINDMLWMFKSCPCDLASTLTVWPWVGMKIEPISLQK